MPFGIPRFPDLIPALRPDLGQPQLKDWNNEPRNIPYLPRIDPNLSITQDIQRFSRRLRGIQRNDIIAAGQRIVWDVTVPEREAWRVRYISVQNGDSTNVTFAGSVLIAGLRASFLRVQLFSIRVSPGILSLLYPTRRSRILTANDGSNEFDGLLEFFQGDRIRIETVEVATAVAPEFVLSFGYELIPNRRSSTQGIAFSGTAV